MATEHNETVAGLAAKLSPTALPATLTFLGYSVATWAQVVALVFGLLQIGDFIYKKYRICASRRKLKEVSYGCDN